MSAVGVLCADSLGCPLTLRPAVGLRCLKTGRRPKDVRANADRLNNSIAPLQGFHICYFP
jgi:hypothetical protein